MKAGSYCDINNAIDMDIIDSRRRAGLLLIMVSILACICDIHIALKSGHWWRLVDFEETFLVFEKGGSWSVSSGFSIDICRLIVDSNIGSSSYR